MTKPEKYFVFGMLAFLSVKHQEIPTLIVSASNIFAYVLGWSFFIAMLWCAIRGEK